ncbi:Transposase [Limosilactobacillus fermentum F-6]|nr:Transposase [Limosilactobacillus fermentum F-6]
MTKFNLELRISIVTQYLTGISFIQLARKYHIANNETILLWVHRFNRFGIAGLKRECQECCVKKETSPA